MALTASGALYAWGKNEEGQLGDFTNKGLFALRRNLKCKRVYSKNVKEGYFFNFCSHLRVHFIVHSKNFLNYNLYMTRLILAKSFNVSFHKQEKEWYESFYQAEVLVLIFSDASNPSEVPNINSVVAVECGDSHSIALTHEGLAFSCGSDSFGQLGCGQPSRSHNCMRGITEMLGSHVTRIACGRFALNKLQDKDFKTQCVNTLI